MDIYPRRLHLKKPTNTRELGGYMTKDGKITKYRRYLRSDMLSGLSETDVNFLLDYGVKTVIDLRRGKELEEFPSSFAALDGVKYVHLPLLEENHPPINENFTMADLYLHMLNNSENLGNLFNCIAENSQGVLLFNCTVGKDRTGITACMLLMLANVGHSDLVADYQVSHTYIRPFLTEFEKRYPDVPMHFAKSEPAYIETFISAVENEMGGIENCLLSKGVSRENIHIIKSNLV